jgi:hypothetical protein
VSLSAGKHTAAVVVVDSFDNYTSSSVSFTAKQSVSYCAGACFG